MARWRHATMDSDEAQAHARRAVDAVARGMPRTVIGHAQMLIHLLDCGLDARGALDYFSALRDWRATGGRVGEKARSAFERTMGRARMTRRHWGIAP